MIAAWCTENVPSPLSTDRERSRDVLGVLACSALKRSYRDVLRGSGNECEGGQGSSVNHSVFVFLSASEEVLSQRIRSRSGHFMPVSLVRSQLDILELPDGRECAVVIETDGLDVDNIVMRIIDKLKHMNIVNVAN